MNLSRAEGSEAEILDMVVEPQSEATERSETQLEVPENSQIRVEYEEM